MSKKVENLKVMAQLLKVVAPGARQLVLERALKNLN